MIKVREGDKVKVTLEGTVTHVSYTGTRFDVETIDANDIESIPANDPNVTIEITKNFKPGDIVKRSDGWGYHSYYTVLGPDKVYSHEDTRVIEDVNLNDYDLEVSVDG